MEKDGCGSGGVWNIFRDVPLGKFDYFSFYRIDFRWDYVLWSIVSFLVWTGIFTKLSIYVVPPYPVKWFCRGCGLLWK